MIRLPALFLLSASLLACEDPPPPWAGAPDGRVRDESEPFLRGRPSSPLGSVAGGGGQSPPAEEAPEEELILPSSGRHGGLWLSCHDHFVPTGEPRRDVTRLALSCGPINGMTRATDLVKGTLTEGQTARRPFTVEAGECLRVFAAGGNGIENLDVRLTSAAGELIGEDDNRRAWAIVEPERPVCSPSGGEVELTVRAARGSGSFAVEIWRMPPRGSD